MSRPEDSPLGQETHYPNEYDPSQLFSIPRDASRIELGITGALPFKGHDGWTAYEISWLDQRGKPQVAIGHIQVPCDSPAIIESKSLKLYLNSFNQSYIESPEEMIATVERDLSCAAGKSVSVELQSVDEQRSGEIILSNYACIDERDVDCRELEYSPALLKVIGESAAQQSYVSHLLKSNCPVTGQPDWASVYIDCFGPMLDQDSLLRYLVSFRQHQEFHEQCVERIFVDLQKMGLIKLTVNARYLRRGGIDINPVRSTDLEYPVIGRTIRQ